jgi:hypothetical protein
MFFQSVTNFMIFYVLLMTFPVLIALAHRTSDLLRAVGTQLASAVVRAPSVRRGAMMPVPIED